MLFVFWIWSVDNGGIILLSFLSEFIFLLPTSFYFFLAFMDFWVLKVLAVQDSIMQLPGLRTGNWITYQEDCLFEVASFQAEVLNSYLHVVEFTLWTHLSRMEDFEAYSNSECIQNWEVVIEFSGQTMDLWLWGICRVLETPMVGLRSQEVLSHYMEHKMATHSWGWPVISGNVWGFQPLSFSFVPTSVVRICPLCRVHDVSLPSVLYYFKEVP